MSVTEKALWVIERNHGRDLTLDDIAQACGVSKYHLAHAFGQSTGAAVMQYARGRRLTEAAQALANGAKDILDLALGSGYSSHEAFSRAFRSRFGVSPESVRANGTLDGLAIVKPMRVPDRPAAQIHAPQFISANEICCIGMSEHYMFGATEGIPGQWQRFMAVASGIPNRIQGIPIGVAMTVDAEGNFDYLCAVQVTAFTAEPSELVQLRIPARRYAVFEHRDHVATLWQTYTAIWDEWLPTHDMTSADAPSIERHKETFDPRTGNGGVDVWIPIEAHRYGSDKGRVGGISG